VKTLHCVSAKDCDVKALFKVRVVTDRVDLLCCKVCHLVSDLKAKNQLVSKVLCQLKHQATVAAPDVKNTRHWFPGRFLVIGHRVLVSVDHYAIAIVVCTTVERRVVDGPVGEASVPGVCDRHSVERIDVRIHTMLILLGHVHVFLLCVL